MCVYRVYKIGSSSFLNNLNNFIVYFDRKEDIVAVWYVYPGEADIAPSEQQHILQELSTGEEINLAITNNANASNNNIGGVSSQDSSLVGEQQEAH